MGDEYITDVIGVINSPYDERDYTLDMLVGTYSTDLLPQSYRTVTTVPVLSQGFTSTCVACSLASCRYIQEELQEGSAEKFSVDYIYGNRLPTDQQTDGMIPRQALQTLVNYGDCHYVDLPGYSRYELAKEYYESKKEKLDDLAYPYRINSYYRLYTVDEIKTAVYELGCAVIVYDMSDSLRNPNAKGYVEYDSTEHTSGMHMVTIVGWTEDEHWIILNSWGTDYGLNGYCYVSFNHPYTEAWAMIDEILYKEIVKDTVTISEIGIFLGIKRDICLI